MIRWGIALAGPYTLGVAFMGMLPLVLTDTAGLTPTAAATFVGFMRLPGLVAPALMAALARRYGAKLVLLASFGAGAAALSALGFTHYGAAFSTLMAAVMLAIAGTPTLITALAMEAGGSDKRRFLSGSITAGKLLGESLMPSILATLFAWQYTGPLFWAVAVALAVSGVQIFLLGKPSKAAHA